MTTITISDVGCTARYTLDGDSLTMTDTGGCRDALADYGPPIDESMSDVDIAEWAEMAWCEGYEGDPEANGLAVRVERN